MRELLRPGYGQALASARLVKELSLADVAAKLKLTVRQVEALESEDVAHLPGDVFLRGFVRNYARLVDLDADELIAPMDAQAAVSETITAHSEGVTMSSGGLRRWLLVPLLILGVFVIFVAVLYQWLRQGEDALVPQTAVETTTAVVTRTLPVSSMPASDKARWCCPSLPLWWIGPMPMPIRSLPPTLRRHPSPRRPTCLLPRPPWWWNFQPSPSSPTKNRWQKLRNRRSKVTPASICCASWPPRMPGSRWWTAVASVFPS